MFAKLTPYSAKLFVPRGSLVDPVSYTDVMGASNKVAIPVTDEYNLYLAVSLLADTEYTFTQAPLAGWIDEAGLAMSLYDPTLQVVAEVAFDWETWSGGDTLICTPTTTGIYVLKVTGWAMDVGSSIEVTCSPTPEEYVKEYIANVTMGGLDEWRCLVYQPSTAPLDMVPSFFDFSKIEFDTKVDLSHHAGYNLVWRPDGYVFFILNYSTVVYIVRLNTPWDPKTIYVIDSMTFDYSVRTLAFSNSGTTLFTSRSMTHAYNGRFYKYQLTVPWELATATEVESIDRDDLFGDTFPLYVDCSIITPDESALITSGSGDNNWVMYKFNFTIPIGSPGSLTTLVKSTDLHWVNAIGGQVKFTPDGKRLFRATSNVLEIYDLQTPWQLDSPIYKSSFRLPMELNISNIVGLSFNNTGTKLFLTIDTDNFVYIFNI